MSWLATTWPQATLDARSPRVPVAILRRDRHVPRSRCTFMESKLESESVCDAGNRTHLRLALRPLLPAIDVPDMLTSTEAMRPRVTICLTHWRTTPNHRETHRILQQRRSVLGLCQYCFAAFGIGWSDLATRAMGADSPPCTARDPENSRRVGHPNAVSAAWSGSHRLERASVSDGRGHSAPNSCRSVLGEPIAIQEFPIAVLTAVRVGGWSQDEQAVQSPLRSRCCATIGDRAKVPLDSPSCLRSARPARSSSSAPQPNSPRVRSGHPWWRLLLGHGGHPPQDPRESSRSRSAIPAAG